MELQKDMNNDKKPIQINNHVKLKKENSKQNLNTIGTAELKLVEKGINLVISRQDCFTNNPMF